MITPTTEQEDLGADVAAQTSTPVAQTRHTPGPWLMAARPSSVVGWPIVAPPNGRVIADLYYVDRDGPAVEIFNRESAANGRLIAAAPELLEACIALQMEAAARGFGLRIADEAIAKAMLADGAPRHGTAAVSSGPTPQSLKAQP